MASEPNRPAAGSERGKPDSAPTAAAGVLPDSADRRPGPGKISVSVEARAHGEYGIYHEIQ